MYGLRDIHRYFQCGQCGCVQIAKTPDELEHYYGATYYSYQKTRRWLKNSVIGLRNHYAIEKRGSIGRLLYSWYPTKQFEFLEPIRKDIGTTARILDVGCGAGELLQSLAALGFRQLFGIDPFISESISYGNNLEIRKLAIEDLQGQFDMIMFHHSFEHVVDPIATLRSAAALLVEGGYCVIRIPTVSSYAWGYYGVNWVQLDAPRHFFLHSIESMKRTAKMANLAVLGVKYDSTAFQFWGSEQYANDIALQDPRSYAVNPRKSMFRRRDIAHYARRADELNAREYGDQAIFWLQKPHGDA